MIRLFKQVYLAPDTFFDWNKDRIVISENVGAELMPLLQESVTGRLLYSCDDWDEGLLDDFTFEGMIDLCDQWMIKHDEDRPIVIYADQKAFPKILVAWLRNICPQITVDQVTEYYQSELYTAINIEGRTGDDTLLVQDNIELPTYNVKDFNQVWDQYPKANQSFGQWIEDNAETFELTFILATYLATGQYKDKVQTFFMRNVRNMLYRNMFDIKREVSQKILLKDFAERMGCQPYTISTLSKLKDDKSPLIEVLYSNRIFTSETLRSGNKMLGEGKGIDWEAITDTDIDNIAAVIEATNVPIGTNTIEEFKWLLTVARNTVIGDNDIDYLLEREYEANTTDTNDRLIDYAVCSAVFINHMLTQEQQYIDTLKIL